MLRSRILCGRSMRMDTGTSKETTTKFLLDILESHEHDLVKSRKAEVYLNLSLISGDDGKKSVEYAEKVKEISDEDSSIYQQAESILIIINCVGEEKISRLKALEKKARKSE